MQHASFLPFQTFRRGGAFPSSLTPRFFAEQDSAVRESINPAPETQQITREKPDSIVHPCIDVRAQFALLRLFRRGGTDAETAISLFHAVDSGQIAGIFGDDLAFAARMANRRATVRWELVPNGQQAHLINDGLADGPALLFREHAKGARLDEALLKQYRNHQKTLGPIPEGSAPRCTSSSTPPTPQPIPPHPIPPQPIPPQPRPPSAKPPAFGSCSSLLRPLGPTGTINGIGSSSQVLQFLAGTHLGILLENHAPNPVTVELIDHRTGASATGVIPAAPLLGSGTTAFHNFTTKGCVPISWNVEIRPSANTSFTPPALPFTPPSITFPLPIRLSFSISSNSFLGEGPCCDP